MCQIYYIHSVLTETDNAKKHSMIDEKKIDMPVLRIYQFLYMRTRDI